MFAKIVLRILPWLIIVVLVLVIFVFNKLPDLGLSTEPEQQISETTVMLERVEMLGKLELVKYSFSEIAEVKQRGQRLNFTLGALKLSGDAEIVLFTKGEAVGCLDLTKILPKDIVEAGDTLFITLPEPELCYFKIDLQNTKVYNFEVDRYLAMDEGSFLDSAYAVAERQIRDAALTSGILRETSANAELILKPLLSEFTDKTILFTRPLRGPKVILPD